MNNKKIAKLLGKFTKWRTWIAEGYDKNKAKKMLKDEEPDLSIRFHTNDGFTTAPFPLTKK